MNRSVRFSTQAIHPIYNIMCTARFLYYFSVYVSLFKELFSRSLVGVFPKSECKGIDFPDTLQMFSGLFLKIVALLM